MKMASLVAAALVCAASPPVLAGDQVPATPEPEVANRAEANSREKPLADLPYTPSLDLASMDRSVEPCFDFYRFSCGGWIKNNPIPPDQASWSVYAKLADENQQFLWGLLDEAARPEETRTPAQQKIGDYFQACMDEPAVEGAGARPIAAELEAIAALPSIDRLAAVLAPLHLTLDTNGMLFGFGAEQDFKNSSRFIGFATAGGLGLPDRDYYTKEDTKSQEIRDRYLVHVAQMLRLLGEGAEEAASHARTVMRIETTLAKASLTRVQKRDPYKIYHHVTRAELQALVPSFRWDDYLGAIGQGPLQDLNVTEPEFYKTLQVLLRSESVADWRTYLRWHLVRARAPYLSSAFVKASFDFNQSYLRGVKELAPRWKRCVRYVDRDLGEALGQVFVEKVFPPPVKQSVLAMVEQIEKAMSERIERLPWMGKGTRKQALAKLDSMRNKVGYPDRWRDYGGLEVRRGDFLGNVERGLRFESLRELARIGRPVDRGEWDMTPPTVNAYYNPSMNDMNFPAGVLLPPLYDPKMDAAPNYGNTGSTIGHELTHGFDDEGRHFDAQGNLRDWWTAQDAKEFEKRASCVSDQYAQYTVVDDIRINSKLTLGEDVADLGGTILAYLAWKSATAGQVLESADGLTPAQRFFVGLAQWACGDETPESKRANALTNPHSPPQYRVNGVVVNMPEFHEAFACKAGQRMVKKDACRIW